ncbi:MAG: hypothetical protein Q9169_003908 [Polycauliona sp. 2 TL-2023]
MAIASRRHIIIRIRSSLKNKEGPAPTCKYLLKEKKEASTQRRMKPPFSHSKPKRHPVHSKTQISYPRTQAHSVPLHAYGHSHPQLSRPCKTTQPQRHNNSHYFQEPQYYGNSRAVPVAYGKPNLVSCYAPEVGYHGTFGGGGGAKKKQQPVKRKPVPPHPSQAQVNYYSKRALPPVLGSRAAVKSQRVQYGYA